MAWQALDRRSSTVKEDAAPALNDTVREKIRSFLPRYETKRAALLPALHVVQDALGHVNLQAMKEIAEILEIPPSQVLDTLTFYTHYWDHPKGRKVIVACRSLSCQIMGADAVLDALKGNLGIDEHGTTKDGAYSLVTEECLAACDHAPCLLVNEKLHKCVAPDKVALLVKDAKNADHGLPRSALFDAPAGGPPKAPTDGRQVGPADPSTRAPDRAEGVGKTSDVREMKES